MESRMNIYIYIEYVNGKDRRKNEKIHRSWLAAVWLDWLQLQNFPTNNKVFGKFS